MQIRTQRYTAEFKNDIIFHVGPLDEKLEVFKKYSGVPDERPPKQSVTPFRCQKLAELLSAQQSGVLPFCLTFLSCLEIFI